MNVRDKLHLNLLHLAICLACVCSLSSCVIYHHSERLVKVSNRDTGAPVQGARFRFTHAVPAVHLPKTPERIDVPLGPNGEAKVRFPVVMGWAKVNGVSALLHPENIRDGGVFELRSESSQAAPKMLLRIERVSAP